MLRAVTLRLSQIAARHQVLVYTHSALVFATPAKQVAQCEVQLGCIGVVLYCFDKCVYGLVLLLVEQEIQTPEVGFGGLAVFNAQLPQVNTRCQPAERKGDGKAQ